MLAAHSMKRQQTRRPLSEAEVARILEGLGLATQEQRDGFLFRGLSLPARQLFA